MFGIGLGVKNLCVRPTDVQCGPLWGAVFDGPWLCLRMVTTVNLILTHMVEDTYPSI